MGRYDDISDAKLRYEIQRFARILQSMEEKNEVLDRTADILTLLGELRRMVFAWEVRSTFRGEAPGDADATRAPGDRPTSPPGSGVGPGGDLPSTSERIVREAEEQQSDFLGGLAQPPEDDEDSTPPPPLDDGPDR